MSADYTVITEENFDSFISSNEVVLVDFWATWCGPCKMLAPFIEEIATEYKGKAAVGKIDVDDCPALAERFGVISIPSVFIFKSGEVKDKLVGFRQKAQLAAAIDNVL